MAQNSETEAAARDDLLNTPIKRVRVYEDIVSRIFQMIEEGNLKIGDRLPSERDLSSNLGVSRSSVREALRALELLGHIETRVGIEGGSFIREVGLEKAQSILRSMFAFKRKSLPDLVEVRLVIETQSVALAALRRDEADLRALDAAVALMEGELAAGDIGLRGDQAFHRAVARATHNAFLQMLSDMMEEMVDDTRLQTLSIEGVPETALSEHKAIVKAVRAKSASAAEKGMRAHLSKAYEISKRES